MFQVDQVVCLVNYLSQGNLFQTELLDVRQGDKVLEIGTGSGYQACVLLEVGAKVFTIEYHKALYDQVRKKLPSMGYNPKFRHGDGTLGWPSQAPFDKIIVTAGAPAIPAANRPGFRKSDIMVISPP